MATVRHDAIFAAPGSAVAAVAWSFRGQTYVTVVAKATFAFALDEDMPRVAAQEIARADVHAFKNPVLGARITSDLAPYLPLVDVVFTGHAHAPPGGGPVRTLPVRLTVVDGEETVIDKRLLVYDAAGFESMPIVYEKAFGGPGVNDNPAGVGSAPESGEPNILHPDDPQLPAGFGPIGRSWPSRKRLLGRTARKYLDAEVARIPDDFDWTYYQVAPPDQQAQRMSGGAWIMLEGLCAPWPFTRMRLPDVSGVAFVYGAAPEGEMIELSLDTVRLDGDDQRCTVLLRGSLPVQGEAAVASLRVVAGVASAGCPLTWPAAAEAPAPALPPDDGPRPTGTLAIVEERKPAGSTLTPSEDAPLLRTLPFVAPSASSGAAPPPRPSSDRAAGAEMTKLRRIPFPGSALPFLRDGSSVDLVPPPPVSALTAGTLVLAPDDPEPPLADPDTDAPLAPAPKDPPRREAIVAPSLDTGPADPAPVARKAPAAAPVGPPTASPALKQGLYGKYGGKR